MLSLYMLNLTCPHCNYKYKKKPDDESTRCLNCNKVFSVELTRENLIIAINDTIANTSTSIGRESIIIAFSKTLITLGIYRGFNYVYWEKVGHKEWKKAGRPLDTTPYLGDKSMVRFC